jgi:HAD superfamily hydrolase (TIGR01458 family)
LNYDTVWISGTHDKDLGAKCQTKGDKTAMDRKFKGVMFDIDGVLEFQGKAYPGAVELLEFLRKNGITIRILSNSTLKSRKLCTEKLNRHGFGVTEAEVVTASWATARYLKTLKPKSCWVMLKGKGIEEFREFKMDQETPEYIVLGDYREEFKFENMNKALKLLLQGTKLIVMIPEKVDHSLGGVELTVGAYGKMLEDAAGIKATYIGKPNPYVFDITLGSMALDPAEVLMVGDRMSTDIIGAKQAGLPSILVKTGEFKPADLEGDIQPDFIVEAVGDIKAFF